MNQLGKDIILGLYGAGKNLALHFCLDAKNGRINLTTRQKPNPLSAPNFCMLLRKHLVGAKLLEINNFDLERVCEFVFETRNELQDRTIRKVFVEVMGSHSNLILTNENNNIIDALKHVWASEHEILPARKYNLPANSKKSFKEISSFEEFSKIINADENIDKQISDNFIGISRSLVNHLLKQDTNIENLYLKLKIFTNEPCNVYFEKVNEDFFPTFATHTEAFYNNFFLDDFYYEKEKQEAFVAKKNSLLVNLQNQLKKYSKRLENINNKLKECSRYGYLPPLR